MAGPEPTPRKRALLNHFGSARGADRLTTYTTVRSGAAVNDGQWHHLVATVGAALSREVIVVVFAAYAYARRTRSTLALAIIPVVVPVNSRFPSAERTMHFTILALPLRVGSSPHVPRFIHESFGVGQKPWS